uniref:Uncharacterized protein n=1 Tax=viral metagenome TaxID=1070528 RepID=A0A6H1ZBK8_9ZZZZ
MLRLIARWLEDHQLVVCALCRKVVFSKDAQPEMTNTGITVPLCSKCHQEMFHPFAKGAKS